MPQLHPARVKEPFLFSQTDADVFDDALFNAVRDNEKSMRALHAAVTTCVNALRTEGMLCEAALLTMKAYTRHISHEQRDRADVQVWATDYLIEQIARWSIIDFYDVD